MNTESRSGFSIAPERAPSREINSILERARFHARRIEVTFQLQDDPLQLGNKTLPFLRFFIQERVARDLAQDPTSDPSLDSHLVEFPTLKAHVAEELTRRYLQRVKKSPFARLKTDEVYELHAPLRKIASRLVDEYKSKNLPTEFDMTRIMAGCGESVKRYAEAIYQHGLVGLGLVYPPTTQERMKLFLEKHPTLLGGLLALLLALTATAYLRADDKPEAFKESPPAATVPSTMQTTKNPSHSVPYPLDK